MVRQEVATLLEQGQSQDAVLAHFVEQQGGYHVLSEPPDTGVGRLTWLVPYLAGLFGAAGVVVAARRWSRRRTIADAPAAAAAGVDGRLLQQLDDELRDLD